MSYPVILNSISPDAIIILENSLDIFILKFVENKPRHVAFRANLTSAILS